MKALIWKEFILVVGVIILLITGCAQQEPMNVKMSRIIASENMKLKEDLRKSDWEIENLKELHTEQVKMLQKIITEHKEQINIWEEKSRENIRTQVKDILDVVLERNTELREEIKALKEDNEKLKIELQGQKK